MPWYRKWNADRNPWKRRQSIVGLLEYAQKRKRVQPYKVLISFIEPLLDDEDYYVQ
jgi:3-methyladenine DNA glycosylase AlkD